MRKTTATTAFVKAQKDSVWAGEQVREFRLSCSQHGQFGTVTVPGDSRTVRDWDSYTAAEATADRMAAAHALRHAQRRFRRGWVPLGHYVTARCAYAGEPQMNPVDLAREILGIQTAAARARLRVALLAAGIAERLTRKAGGCAS